MSKPKYDETMSYPEAIRLIMKRCKVDELKAELMLKTALRQGEFPVYYPTDDGGIRQILPSELPNDVD